MTVTTLVQAPKAPLIASDSPSRPRLTLILNFPDFLELNNIYHERQFALDDMHPHVLL